MRGIVLSFKDDIIGRSVEIVGTLFADCQWCIIMTPWKLNYYKGKTACEQNIKKSR